MSIAKQKSKFSIQLGNWQFMPGLKLTLITLALLPILVYLGIWQLGRAEEKEKNISDLATNSHQAAVNLTAIKEPSLHKDRFTPVIIDGIFINKYNFLLDNQMYDHKPGYRVLTVVSAPHIEKLILVDRGWIPLGEKRQQLPTIEIIFGLKQIHGIINTIGTGIELVTPEARQEDKWPRVISTLNYEFIAQQLNHPVYDFVIQLQGEELPHYVYPPASKGVSTAKHYGYAVQWFIFASLLVLYYLIVSTKRRK